MVSAPAVLSDVVKPDLDIRRLPGRPDGPAQDCIGAVPPAKHLMADKGYDSTPLRDWLKSRGTQPVIPLATVPLKTR